MSIKANIEHVNELKAKAAEKDKAKFFNAAQEMIFDDDEEDEDVKKKTISKNDFFMKLGGGNKPKAKPAPVNKLDQF